MTRHIIEALGKTTVTIEDGKVVDVSEPKIQYCPLFAHHRDIEEITPQIVKENMEFRIKDFGMCSKNREIRMKDYLNFGISETISTLLKENVVDCAIMVLEGCGTIIITESEIAQGVGGRVSALIETTPIPEVINKIGKEFILDSKNATINQPKGIKKAIELGYKNIAVTIATVEDIQAIEEIKKENPDVNIYIFVVHTSKLTKNDAEILFKNCDVITACASKYVREIGKKDSLKTVGQSIPIYANTKKGKEFLEMRLNAIGGEKPKKENPDIPYPLI